MATKFDLITQTYETISNSLSNPSEWQGFLNSASRNYKCRFDEQVLIYSQRPDATAVLELDRWSTKFNRWVNNGATGIAVFDNAPPQNKKVKYYFDISDTHEGRERKQVPKVNLWQMEERYTEEVIETLANTFGTLDNDSDLVQAIFSAAKNATNDNIDDYLQGLYECLEDSFLEEFDQDYIEKTYKDLVANSIAYMMLTRLGYSAQEYFNDDDFRDITQFNTKDVFNSIGFATSDISEMALREISRTITALQKEEFLQQIKQNNKERGSDYGIHENRGAILSQPSDARDGGSDYRQIWTVEGNISGETSSSEILQHGDVMHVERAPIGSGETGQQPEGAVDRADEERPGRDRGTESQRPDEMGGHDEQHISLSGRDNNGAGNLRINDEKADNEVLSAFFNETKSIEKSTAQVSFFDAVIDATPDDAQTSFFTQFEISQDVIDAALTFGPKSYENKNDICAFYMKDKTLVENIRFVKEQHINVTRGFVYDNHRIAVAYSEKGMHIAKGKSAKRTAAITISWQATAQRIKELLEIGRYMSQEELDNVPGIERSKIAQSLLYAAGDLSEKGIEENLLPTIRGVHKEHGGYPDMTQALAQMLTDDEKLQTIVDEVGVYTKAITEDKELLRFNYKHYYKLQQPVSDLQREPRIFTSDEQIEYTPQFISQDKIDNILTGALTSYDYRLRVYSNFIKNKDSKARADFLKDMNGTGGSSLNEGFLNYDYKGIRIDIYKTVSPVEEFFMPWNKAQERIAQLISQNKFLQVGDEEKMHEFEIEHLARNIYSSFARVSNVTQIPYPVDGNYYNSIDVIKEKLNDTQEITKIQDMLLPLLAEDNADNKNYSTRKQTWEELLQYKDGTFSLFGVKHNTAKEQTNYDVSISNIVEEINEENFDNEYSDDELASIYGGDTNAAQSEIAEDMDYISPVIKEPQDKSETTDTLISNNSVSIVRAKFGEQLLHPDVPYSERNNFKIKDSNLGVGTPSEKYAANISAIKLLKQLEEKQRLATPQEQEILSRYVGWGGLSDCFKENDSRYLELKNLLDEDEYAAARESTLTAFYTAPVIVDSIYKGLDNMGFKTGNILEPSCGTGNFLGMLPESMQDSKMYGVEIDSVSGRIAQQLYQKSNISIQGYETVNAPDSFFDVAIGNVPFGDFKVSDRRYNKNNWLIHDYFFGKTLDKVRPGGIVAFVTSKGTMDKKNSLVRKYLAQRAELVGAIRLPDNAFKANAGTDVTSDIIFLQKRDRIVDIEPDWVHLENDENGIAMNSYFVQNKQMVLGDMVMESTRFGMDSTCKARAGADLERLLQQAVNNLHAKIPQVEIAEITDDNVEDKSIPADPTVRNFSYTIYDGQIYFRENSLMSPAVVNKTAENRIKGMIKVRDCVRDLIEMQTENYSDNEIKARQTQLNTLYDDYTKKYGLLSSRANKLAFDGDSSYSLLTSLEIVDGETGLLKEKAAMFTKRTIKPHTPVTSVDTASEALAVSISEKACVDMEYMCDLSGKTAEEIENELAGVIFRNVQCSTDSELIPKAFVDKERFSFVSADEYLSGNVREKLAMAKALLQAMPSESVEYLQNNIYALERVQPVDLTASEIAVRLGATWLPVDDVQDFIFETLSTPNYYKNSMRVRYSEITSQWIIDGKNADRGNIKATTTYGTSRMNAYKIIEETLNLKDVRISDRVENADGSVSYVINKKETAIAQSKQEIIKSVFNEWLWKNPQRRERLARMYNDKFNSVRPREYNGQHITFEGITPEISLREHQVNAVAHIMYGGNTLLAHVVGAGKTYEMIAAAMESKRLGLCNKPLFVVPNHLTEQWASDFLQLYPSANVLVATKKDFETKNRKKFCGRIATGEYDAVIIGQSQLEKIPMSIERQRNILEQQMNEVLDGINMLKANKAENFSIKELEKTRKSIKTKLDHLNDQSRKDDVVTFEELGVDRLFVDEAHYYKNLFLFSKMRNVSGIAQTEAQKSSDLFMKCRYIDELTGGKGIVFATGTPVSNSMVELYTMQRYLQYDELQSKNLQHFDAWASTFGETVNAVELTPEGGGYKAKTRFAKFYNLPELMFMFKEVADIQTADMLNLPVPKANYHNVSVKPSEEQKEIVTSLGERAEDVRNNRVEPTEDNMLKITGDGRKLALDQRLFDDTLPDFEGSKINACVDNVYRIWNENHDTRATQLIFCDYSTPKYDGTFSVYNDTREKLIARGIPEQEIFFIHDANSDIQKKNLFAKMRRGEIRVLLGSTAKMGAGTNIQERLLAIHNVDCPWRPSDLEQRAGRIVRQGNTNKEVHIFSYVTEQTFDAYSYQLVENKQRFISQIMTSKSPVRSAEDFDEEALSYAEIKMLATGNPYIKEKMDLDIKVAKLKLLKQNHLSERYALEDKLLKIYPAELKYLEQRIAGCEKDVIVVKSHVSTNEDKKFTHMKVGDDIYTEREEAGKALLDKCLAVKRPGTVDVGEYRGFNVQISKEIVFNIAQYKIILKGALSHDVEIGNNPSGNITRMDNVLENISSKLETAKLRIETVKQQIKEAELSVNKDFSQEVELQEKLERLAALDALLNVDANSEEITDSIDDDSAKDIKIVSEQDFLQNEKSAFAIYQLKDGAEQNCDRFGFSQMPKFANVEAVNQTQEPLEF